MTLKIEHAKPKEICGVRSSTRKNAMVCELPPGHNVVGKEIYFGPEHYGRDRRGAWRLWSER